MNFDLFVFLKVGICTKACLLDWLIIRNVGELHKKRSPEILLLQGNENRVVFAVVCAVLVRC